MLGYVFCALMLLISPMTIMKMARPPVPAEMQRLRDKLVEDKVF